VYDYYDADDTNLARRGQVRRVEAPGGYWRELDYGGAGWLVRREVQTADGSEVTVYTYDAWGRLRAIDYPRSADVRMGWDGESRRVWVQDGAGRREYTYTAWGQVARQRGCCGSADGIEVVAVWAIYDEAGRKTSEREERENGGVVREVRYAYDGLGRLRGASDGQRQLLYRYDNAGRLWQIEEPNQQVTTYSYYGADTPTQRGALWRVEYRAPDGTLQQGYEYGYDLLWRTIEVSDLVAGSRTVLEYDGVGRCTAEYREGVPSYRVERVYQLDGQLHQEYIETVYEGRADRVWRLYDYDSAGYLKGTYDLLGGVNWWFDWEQDRLVRWHADDRSYAREFEYDEEGRIVAIWLQYAGWRDLGYAYQFNADGGRVRRHAGFAGLEFRQWCGGLTEWYREEHSEAWAVWRQGLFSEGCCGCGSTAAWNERAWSDAALLPEDSLTQTLPAFVPFACAVACGCAAVCAIGVIVPCVQDCWGTSDPVGCVKQCVEGTVRELPRPVQILCGACLIGCALCLVLLPVRPFPPRLSPPSAPTLPAPPTFPTPPPVVRPQPRPPQPPKQLPPVGRNPREENPPWHPQPRPYEPPPWFPEPIVPPDFTEEDRQWCVGFCMDHCANRWGFTGPTYRTCMRNCIDMCTGVG
jgi:YD repeat-containing protein